MPSIEELTLLLERVQKATGPDREIDWRIAEVCSVPEPWRESALWPPFTKGSKVDKAIPQYTASLDAITALIERQLPGWQIACGTCGEDDMPWACLTEHEGPCQDFPASAPTIPLALCAAFLQALISGGENA